MIGCQIMTKPSWGVVYNVSQNPVSLLCTMWLIMTKPGWVVVYNVSQNLVNLLCSMCLIMTKPARLGCSSCEQCIPEPSQPENFGHFCEFMAKVFKHLISYTAV